MAKRYFEFQDAKSDKFWEIELSGSSFTVGWGKRGTPGQSKNKTFSSSSAAQKEFDKLVAQKLSSGYVEKTPGATQPSAPPPKKPAAATKPSNEPAKQLTSAPKPAAKANSRPQPPENPLSGHLDKCPVRIGLCGHMVSPFTKLSGPGLAAVVDWMVEHGATALELRRTFEGAHLFRPDDYGCLERLKGLRHLDLHGNEGFDDQAIEVLKELRELEYLQLSSCRVSAKGLSVLSSLSKLRELKLGRIDDLTDADLKFLSKMPELRRLEVESNNLTAAYLSHLEGGRLEYLSSVTLTSKEDVERLAKLTTLKEVRFGLASDDIDCSALKDLKSLEFLFLGHRSLLSVLPEMHSVSSVTAGRATVDELKALMALPGLKKLHLDLGGCSEPEAISEKLAKLVGLETLDLGSSDIKEPTLKFLSAMPELRELTIPCKVGPATLRLLKRCEKLESLAVGGVSTLKDLTEYPALRRLRLGNKGKPPDAEKLAFLAECPCLEELEFRDIQPTVRDIEEILKIRSLRKLVVKYKLACDDAILQALSSRPDIDLSETSLCLDSATPKGLAALGGLSRIEGAIRLEEHWSAADLKPLSENPSIAYLHVGTDAAGLAELAKMPRLTMLHLRTDDPISLAALAGSRIGLLSMSELHPSVNVLRLGKDAAPSISRMKTLTDLNLLFCEVDDDFVEKLAELPYLAEANLHGAKITDRAMDTFAKMRGLRDLDLREARQVTDKGIAKLAGLGLIELCVTGAAVTGICMEKFQTPPTLRKLVLCGKEFGDDGLELVVGIKGLQELNIGGTSITDRALDLLRKTSLKKVEMRGCDGLTFGKVRAFKEEMRHRTPYMSVFEDVKERLPKVKTVTWEAERTLAKEFRADKRGALNEALVRQLERLGAKSGDLADTKPDWPQPIRILAAYKWPEDKIYSVEEHDHFFSPSKIDFSEQTETDELAEYRCLQERPFLGFGLGDDGTYMLIIPLDTDMPEDPPVYVLPHDAVSPDDAYELQPERLSSFLERVRT